jgi:hypothetical protein
MDDLDVGPREPRGKGCCQVGVDLDRSELRRPLPEQIGRQAGPGADLQHVVAEVRHLEDPREEVGFEHPRPFGTGQELKVQLVHRCLLEGSNENCHPRQPATPYCRATTTVQTWGV